MSYDELELDKLGDEKTALFFLISDTDSTYNFIVALAYSQMFNLLCERADNKYGGRLPHHVRVLWDEAANTGQVPGLEKIVAVIRSREISLTLFYQAILDFILKSNPLMQKLKKKFQLLEPSLKDEGHLRSTGDALLLKRIIRAVCCADDHGHGQQKERETYQH